MIFFCSFEKLKKKQGIMKINFKFFITSLLTSMKIVSIGIAIILVTSTFDVHSAFFHRKDTMDMKMMKKYQSLSITNQFICSLVIFIVCAIQMIEYFFVHNSKNDGGSCSCYQSYVQEITGSSLSPNSRTTITQIINKK